MALAEAREAAALFTSHYGRFRIVMTNEERPTELDGLVMDGDRIVCTCEIKVRNYTHQGLLDRFGGEWLLSFSKLQAGLDAHRLLGVGMLGLLYCKIDKTLLVVRLVSDDGMIGSPTRIEATQTQATVNGQVAIRNNCYIDVTKAHVIRANHEQRCTVES